LLGVIVSKKRIFKKDIQHILDSLSRGDVNLAFIGFNTLIAQGYDVDKVVKLLNKYVEKED
jgi:hypothetical protein